MGLLEELLVAEQIDLNNKSRKEIDDGVCELQGPIVANIKQSL